MTEPRPAAGERPPLVELVTDIVSQVILEQTGRLARPAPDAPLVSAAHLDSLQLTSLALALQQRLDVVFDAIDLNPRSMGTINKICALIERQRTAAALAAERAATASPAAERAATRRATLRRVTVLGGGKIGRMVAHFLAHSNDYRVRIADSDPSAVESLVADLPHTEATTADFTDAAALDAAMRGAEAVVSCAPFHCNALIAERARALGLHYLDLTEDVDAAEQVMALADGAETAFIPQCGLAPGFITIVAMHLIKPMSAVTDLRLRVGALPRYPSNRLQYNLTWSTEGLINEYCNPCGVVLDGELTRVQPLEGLERLTIDGVEYEAFNTSGGLGTLAQSLLGVVHNVNYKSLRYPGHNHLIKFLLEDLKMRDDRDTLRAIFDRSLPATFRDQVVIFVSATGTYRGKLTENTYARTIYHREIGGHNWSGIQITTAAGVCAVLDLLFEGALPQAGFVRLEQVDYERFIANRFGRYYA